MGAKTILRNNEHDWGGGGGGVNQFIYGHRAILRKWKTLQDTLPWCRVAV